MHKRGFVQACWLIPAMLWATPALVQATDRDTLLGRWHGQQFLDGRPQCWLDEYRADGSFVSDFLVFNGRQWERYKEEGRWSLSANTLTLATTSVNARSPGALGSEQIDRYIVNRLDTQQFEYTEQASNVPFSARRVSAGFILSPSCAP
jgi:hypothetical protein